MAGNLATIKAGSASMDPNPVAGLCVATTSGDVLRRPGEKHDGTDALAKGKPGDCRQGAVGAAKHFGQCSDSGMVEPKMQKISAAGLPENFRANDNSGQSVENKGVKEQCGRLEPTARRVTGGAPNSKLQGPNDKAVKKIA
jgi:hypothetical protein